MAAPNKKLLLGICFALLLLLLAAALIYSFSLTLPLSHLINYSPNLYTAFVSALHHQWWLKYCRPWPIEANKLTPPLLVFLLLNLIVGALLLTNSGFLKTHTQHHRKIDTPFDLKDSPGRAGSKKKTTHKANVPSSIPASSSTNPHHGSSTAAPAMLKQLTRSRSITMATSGAYTTSPAAAVRSEELQQLAQITDYNLLQPSDPQSTRKKKLKKKRGESSSNYSQQQQQLDGAADHSLQRNPTSLKKAPSAPPPQSSVNASSKDGDGGRGDRDDQDEVDRRAEEFIGKFYLQMRMQRLASMERYNQRLDRSYGR